MRWLTHLGGARVTIGTGLGLIAVGDRDVGLAVLVALTLSHIAVHILKRAVAGAVALAHPLTAPVLLPLAAWIAYSRVALRVHHVGDVLAGVALGAAGVAAASALL